MARFFAGKDYKQVAAMEGMEFPYKPTENELLVMDEEAEGTENHSIAWMVTYKQICEVHVAEENFARSKRAAFRAGVVARLKVAERAAVAATAGGGMAAVQGGGTPAVAVYVDEDGKVLLLAKQSDSVYAKSSRVPRRLMDGAKKAKFINDAVKVKPSEVMERINSDAFDAIGDTVAAGTTVSTETHLLRKVGSLAKAPIFNSLELFGGFMGANPDFRHRLEYFSPPGVADIFRQIANYQTVLSIVFGESVAGLLDRYAEKLSEVENEPGNIERHMTKLWRYLGEIKDDASSATGREDRSEGKCVGWR